jgi:HPt (histidine-containing phosphotransfer) domain-containing protein
MSEDELERLMRELRRQYVAESAPRLRELRDQLERVPGDPVPALEALRRLFHRLAGSGGSYGFPRVTLESRRGEQLAEDLLRSRSSPTPAEITQLRELVDRVEASFEQARQASLEG